MFILFADIFVNGVAAFSVGLVVYLWRLSFQQKRERRTQEKEREKHRRGHWGYE
jgi:uncharacterized protein (DUF2062 family)